MNEVLPYHLFAHQSGRYQTVEALGISEADCKAVEQFFFGQTNSREYLKSLQAEPGIIWRSFDGQVAITRVREGMKDQNGRTTLAFETALIPRQSAILAAKRLDQIALGEWRKTGDGISIGSEAAGDPGILHPSKVSDVTMSFQSEQRVVRSASGYSLRDVAKIVSSCIASPDFSLCFKSLNPSAPVTINLVWQESTEPEMAESRINSSIKRSAPPQPILAQRPVAGVSLIAAAVYIALGVQLLLFFMATRTSTVQTTDTTLSAQKYVGDRLDKMDQEFRAAISELRKSQDAAKSEMMKDFDDLKGLISTTEKEIDTLRTTVSAAATEINGLKASVSSASNGVDSLNKAFVSSSRDLAPLQSDVKRLNDAIVELKTILNEKFNALEKSVKEAPKSSPNVAPVQDNRR